MQCALELMSRAHTQPMERMPGAHRQAAYGGARPHGWQGADWTGACQEPHAGAPRRVSGAHMRLVKQARCVRMQGSGMRPWLCGVQGIEWTGYDGAENIELATEDVHFADLTVPQWFGRKYDWVLSLEVCPQYPALVIATSSLSAPSGHVRARIGAACGLLLTRATCFQSCTRPSSGLLLARPHKLCLTLGTAACRGPFVGCTTWVACARQNAQGVPLVR